MLSGFIAVIVKGSIDAGGFGDLLDVYQEGNRSVWLEIDPDPRYRHTIWSIVIGTV